MDRRALRRTRYATAWLMPVVMVAACAQAAEEGSTEGPSEVVIAEVEDLQGWFPYGHSNNQNYAYWWHMLDPLVTYDYTNAEFVGVLATDWEADGEDWIFNLREGVVFHDGSPFTAADVVHSLERMRDDENSLQSGNVNRIVDLEAIDDHTVRITTDVPDAQLLNNLYRRFITSKAHYDELGAEEADRNPIGTGPFKFVEWEPGSRLVLERFDDYWGGPAAVERVTFRPITEASTRVAALERGEVDIIPNVPSHEVSRLEAIDGIRIERVPSLRMMYYVFNPAYEPFDDVLVRRAIQHAIDVDTIIETIMDGYANRMAGPIPEGVFGSNPDWEPAEYDPELARRLLEEAGYEDGISFELWTADGRNPNDMEVSQAIAAQLGEVGMDVTVQTSDYSTYSDMFNSGQLGMFIHGRGGYIDAGDVWVQFFRDGVTDRTSYSTPELNDLLDRQLATLDPAEREQVLHQASEIIREDVPAIYLWTLQDLYGVSERVDWTPRREEYILSYDIAAVR